MSQAAIVNYLINGGSPVTVGGTGTTAKYFPAPSANFTAGAGTTPSATNATGQLAVPADNRLNGQQFTIAASGNFEVGSGGACPNVTIEIVANTGTPTSPTYTQLMTSGLITAQNLTGTFYDWFFEADVQGTNGSGTLQGVYNCVVDTTLVKNNHVLENTISGLSWGIGTVGVNSPSNVFAPSSGVFGLVVRVTFSVSEPGNAANMYEFALY